MPDSRLFSPFQLNTLTLQNRVIKSATYEGMAENNVPSERLINWHSNIVRGGVAMTTVAYGAVSEFGATFPQQIILREEAIPGLAKLTDAIHREGGLVSIQLAHCGFFSKNTSLKSRPVSPSRTFNKLGAFSGLPFSTAMRETDLKRTVGEFVNAALVAKSAGFDAIELHCGHGYLLSQFLSPAFNRRKDSYGGSVENRLRFPLEVITAIRQAVGAGFPVLVKMNLHDGFKGGLDENDSVKVAMAFAESGVDALVLSGGFTSVSPFYLLRGSIPIKEMIEVETNWVQRIGVRLFGRMIIREIPFQEAFFRDQALRIREAVDVPLVYIGGAASIETMESLVEQGFDLIALGRPLIHDPAFVNKLKTGELVQTGCTYCNKCIPEIDRGGVRCVLEENE